MAEDKRLEVIMSPPRADVDTVEPLPVPPAPSTETEGPVFVPELGLDGEIAALYGTPEEQATEKDKINTLFEEKLRAYNPEKKISELFKGKMSNAMSTNIGKVLSELNIADTPANREMVYDYGNKFYDEPDKSKKGPKPIEAIMELYKKALTDYEFPEYTSEDAETLSDMAQAQDLGLSVAEMNAQPEESNILDVLLKQYAAAQRQPRSERLFAALSKLNAGTPAYSTGEGLVSGLGALFGGIAEGQARAREAGAPSADVLKQYMAIETAKGKQEPKAATQNKRIESMFKIKNLSEKTAKDYINAKNVWQEFSALIDEAKKEKNPSAQYALIKKFEKSLDPTSAVREGEFAMAKDTSGLIQSWINAYNKLKSGELISSGQIDNMAKIAHDYYKIAASNYQTAKPQLVAFGTAIGLTPEELAASITNYDVGEIPEYTKPTEEVKDEFMSIKPENIQIGDQVNFGGGFVPVTKDNIDTAKTVKKVTARRKK